MAKEFSFDIESDYDIAEVTNAVDQAQREISQRFDLKDTPAAVDFGDKDKTSIALTGDSAYQLDVLVELLSKKFIRREVPLAVLALPGKDELSGKEIKRTLALQKGLDQDKAKQITKAIRDTYPKIKTQIQGQTIRVAATSKDELQAVMQLLRAQEYPFPLQFTNYR